MRNADPFRALQNASRPLPQRRRFGRLRVNDMAALGLGKVQDISASGMRVVRPRGRLLGVGDVRDLIIEHGDERITLRAKVAWAEKRRGVGCVHAFEFINTSESDRRILSRLVRQAWDTLTVAAK